MNAILRKILAVALALAVGVTFIPLFGDMAYAEGEEEIAGDVPTDVIVTEDIETPAIEAPSEGDAVVGEPDVDVQEEAEGVDEPLAASALAGDEFASKATQHDAGYCLKTFSLKMKNPKKTLHIEATFSKKIIMAGVFVDGSENYVKKFDYSKAPTTSVKGDVDLSDFSAPAQHKITFLYIFDSAGNYSYKDQTIQLSMYDKPSSKGDLGVYWDHLEYTIFVDPNLINYRLYLDYSTDGKTWKSFGPMSYAVKYKIPGLQPNTDYKIRTYYYYKGYKGTDTGNVLNLGTYRTGTSEKVAVKSVKVKAYKVKKKKMIEYGAVTGTPYKIRVYKYKVKVIVKLKKKPGTNYIWINGKRFKGNKKKYTVKLGSFTKKYYSPKGDPWIVNIHTTYSSSVQYGCSPMYSVTKKLK